MRGASRRAKKMVRNKRGEFVELRQKQSRSSLLSRRNFRSPWTAKDVRYLKELARQNTPTRVISIKLGRTEAAVRGKARQIRLSLKPTNQRPYGLLKRRGSQSKRSHAH